MLCFYDDYAFKLIPYRRKSINGNQGPSGFRVAKELLKVVNGDKWHDVYLDKFLIFSVFPGKSQATINTSN